MHGSLNEAIEKVASALAHAAVSAIHGSSAQASEPSTQVTASSESERPEISPPSTLKTSNRATNVKFPSSFSGHNDGLCPQVPAKLVKEIISGDFMELSKLLPKSFNTLNPLHDEPLTLTAKNSAVKVNKAKATSITDIAELTTAFTAYMGVLVSTFPHRAPEFLE